MNIFAANALKASSEIQDQSQNAYISWIGSLKLSWFHKYSLAISIHEGKANLTSLGGRGVIKNQRPSNENICKNVLLFTQLVRFSSQKCKICHWAIYK